MRREEAHLFFFCILRMKCMIKQSDDTSLNPKQASPFRTGFAGPTTDIFGPQE